VTVHPETPQKLAKNLTVKGQKKYLNNSLWNAGQDVETVHLQVCCQKYNRLFGSFSQSKVPHILSLPVGSVLPNSNGVLDIFRNFYFVVNEDETN
jgi:hypothetical protein